MNYKSGEKVYIGDWICLPLVDFDEVGEITRLNDDHDSVNITIAGGSFSNYPIDGLQLYKRGNNYYVERLQKTLAKDKQNNSFASILCAVIPYVNDEGIELLKRKLIF